MQTANLWEGNNLSRFGRLDRPAGGRVLFQREVRAGAVVVIDIRRLYPPRVPFRCQPMTVSGFTVTSISRQFGKSRDSSTQGMRSVDRSEGLREIQFIVTS
jgi:hypothetical protein